MTDKKSPKKKQLKAIKNGVVKFGPYEVKCAILNDENETTVFTVREFEKTIGIAKQKGGESVANLLPTFMRNNAIKPYIDHHLPLSKFFLIPFSLARGGKANGITVNDANKIMRGWIEAKKEGVLNDAMKRIADTMQSLINAAAVGGFTQIIHEQLGYENKRHRAITELFNRIFEEQAHPWEHEFPIEYYENLFRIKGKTEEWKDLLRHAVPGTKPQTPYWVGKETRDIIYRRLKPAGILDVLEKKNPRIGRGGRATRHHQHLTKEQGLKILQRHLGAVMNMMEISKDWREFYSRLDEKYPLQNNQSRFDFMGESRQSIEDQVHKKLL